MLLILFLFQHAEADIPRAPSIIKNITSCPDVGYFFHREVVPNAIEPGPCLLCFCRETSAVCWPRDSSRCDVKNYRHYGERQARSRRSPGFGDIFFRDAARDIFDKRTEEQCKPYESSFSEGCPPADWCIGCTVCDCDANGRWDCHVLSFCPDKNGKQKKMKAPVASSRKRIVKRNDINRKTITNVKNTKPVKHAGKKPPYKKPPVKQPVKKAHTKNINSKKIHQVNKTHKKPKNPTHTKPANKKVVNKKPTARDNTKKAYRRALQNVKQKNDTVKLAEAIVKRVMTKVEKMMLENQKNNANNMAKGKVVQKRSMQKHYKSNKGKAVKSNNNKHNKTVKKVNKKPWNKKVSLKKQTPRPKSKKWKRQKRSLTSLESMSNNYVVEPTPLYQTFWDDHTNIELVENRNFNYTTYPTQSKSYYKYDVSKDDKIKQNTKPYIPQAKTTLFEHIFHTNLSSALLFHHKKSTYDEWEDLDKIYKNRKHLTTISNSRERIIQNSIENKNISQNITKGKVCGFKKIFSKFFFGLNPNNTDEVKAKVKSINLLSMLRTLLDTVFDKQKNRSKKYIRNHSQYKNWLNALCKNFGACHADLKDKTLKSKLNDLEKETRDILKTVSSIKGLLYLLNSENVTYNRSSEDDMEKLKAILREQYSIEATIYNLTETQRLQVNYIKQNAEEFVKSVEKFAFTLNDILNTIQRQNSSNKSKRTAYRYLRCAKHSSARNDNQTFNDKVTRLKKLLLSYNLVQNRFMSKMYDALTGLESNTTSKMNDNKDVNDSVSVDDYSKSVITNLRKLNNLGQKLSPKRLKREAMGDDDAIEYLLMLMEYLLKQNKPVDTAPVNDGIDLLIDAIKHSPDIKPIKATKFRPFRPSPTRTTDSLENDLNTLHTVENSLKGNNNFKAMDPLSDDIDENVKFIKGDEYKPHESKVYKFRKNIDEETTENIPVYINTKKESDKDFEDKTVKPKYEVFNAEAEEEYDGETTTKRMDTSIDTTKADYRDRDDTEIHKEHEKLQNVEYYSTGKEAGKGENYRNPKISPGLDWVDDTGDQEPKTTTTVTPESTTHTTQARRTLKSKLVTRTSKRHKDKYANPVSSMSSEELQTRRPSKKSNDVGVGGNNMDIFNSLDYNTEKPDMESDSKEDKIDAFSDFV